MSADDMTAAEHLAEARRCAGQRRQAFGEFGDKVDAWTLSRAATFFSAAKARATSALAMLKADEPRSP